MRFNVLLLLLPALLQPAIADGQGQWQHGVSTFDEFKYGPDFEHFDYANPDAPKGNGINLVEIAINLTRQY